ncbi:MAG: hypothetical protein A2Z14_00275 [Chloroflexi bacterium RBG_16_48_8]|nr:MAG: hypothetical protein A2Z14_00275 [Chloroflexi bacterium RBG_16_48_8]
MREKSEINGLDKNTMNASWFLSMILITSVVMGRGWLEILPASASTEHVAFGQQAREVVHQLTEKVYYVDQNHLQASNENPGTMNAPWLTIQHAADVSLPGDRIVVKAGNYSERVQVTRSGTQENPIVFRTEGAVTSRGFTIRADYIHIVGFEITDTEGVIGSNSRAQCVGVHIEGKGNEIVENNIHDTTCPGVDINAYPHDSAETSFNIVRNNKIYRAGLSGIYIYGQYNLIEGNDISHILQYAPGWINPGSGIDADGIRFFGVGHTIRGNFIHDITFDDPENVNPHIDCFQTWETAIDMLFENNVCRIPKPPPTTSFQFFMVSTEYGPVRGLTIRNNVFISDSVGYGPVNLSGLSVPIEDITIVHNTFVRTGGPGPYAIRITNAINVVIKNNIFYDHVEENWPYLYCDETDRCEGQVTGLDVGHNLVYRSEGLPGGSLWPGDLWQVDPQFVAFSDGDFHLKPESPAIDAGVDEGILSDFEGNVRPQGEGFDIGAYEFPEGPTFMDVPFDHPYHNYIDALYQEGYTAGCNVEPMMYCPERIMNRAESAVFVERGIHGAEYDPLDPIEVDFADVALDAWYADWVHGLWDDGYTAGCNADPLEYCPERLHTRAEGCVFYLRMMYGKNYQPPDPPKGYFKDVDTSAWYADWVDACWEAGIAEPCATEPDLLFCPDDGLTRAVAAYMMVKAKGLLP